MYVRLVTAKCLHDSVTTGKIQNYTWDKAKVSDLNKITPDIKLKFNLIKIHLQRSKNTNNSLKEDQYKSNC